MSDEIKITAWKVTLKNNAVEHPLAPSGPVRNDLDIGFSTSFEVDQETYEQAMAAQGDVFYTVTQRFDLNPWHWHASGGRARVRRIRRIVMWEFRRRVLRRPPLETAEITVPNCRLEHAG